MKTNIYIAVSGLLAGVLIGYFGTIFFSDLTFKEQIRKKTFDECFSYYAGVDRETGISDSIIQVCKDKADNLK